MTCKDCETFQDKTTNSYYYRWDIANIEIRACKKHIKEVMAFLNTKHKDNK